jgi:hypothetical protein
MTQISLSLSLYIYVYIYQYVHITYIYELSLPSSTQTRVCIGAHSKRIPPPISLTTKWRDVTPNVRCVTPKTAFQAAITTASTAASGWLVLFGAAVGRRIVARSTHHLFAHNMYICMYVCMYIYVCIYSSYLLGF